MPVIPRIPCLFFLSLRSNTKKSVLPCQPIKALHPPPQIILFGCPSLAYSPISKTTSIFNKCQTCPDDMCPLYLSAFECKSELAPCPEFVEERSFVPYKGLSKMHLQEWEINRVVCDSSCGDSRFLQLHTRQKMRGGKKTSWTVLGSDLCSLFSFHVSLRVLWKNKIHILAISWCYRAL